MLHNYDCNGTQNNGALVMMTEILLMFHSFHWLKFRSRPYFLF